MNSVSLSVGSSVLALFLVLGQHMGPTIPAAVPHTEPPRDTLPIDQPPVVVRGEQRPQQLNSEKVKQQADELAKLAQSIPPDINKVAAGQLPKDLIARLKQIEKLSKELRSQISR
jgi:hypothetical protein